MVESEYNTTATVEVTSRNRGYVVIDQTSPFFPHALDSTRMYFFHTKFYGNI